MTGLLVVLEPGDLVDAVLVDGPADGKVVRVRVDEQGLPPHDVMVRQSLPLRAVLAGEQGSDYRYMLVRDDAALSRLSFDQAGRVRYVCAGAVVGR